MKEVLILSSSPRKQGNSQLLCEAFQKGAEESGHKVTLVRLAEKRIGFCRACDGCMRHEGRCVLQDDMAQLLEQYACRIWTTHDGLYALSIPPHEGYEQERMVEIVAQAVQDSEIFQAVIPRQ